MRTADRDRWRVGRKVPRNIYRDDEPIAMLATPEEAAAMVALLNAGERCIDPGWPERKT